MKIKVFLFLFLLTITQNVFTQSNTTENRPKAFLFSSGSRTPAEPIRPPAYLLSSESLSETLTRPRVVKTVETNTDEVSPSKVKTDFTLERQAFELINKQRATLALEPLAWSDEVAKIARLHSENMAKFKFFSHEGIDGLMVNDRADAFGINKWRAISENIAYNRGYENPIEFAVERWMLSPKHRDNLLNSRWEESGIGIAISADGTYYFTEVFLLRK